MNDRNLPTLRRRFRHRYPGITIKQAIMCQTAYGHSRQMVVFHGQYRELIAAGLITREQLDLVLAHHEDSRRQRPTSEFGDQLSIYPQRDGSLELSLFVDSSAPGDDKYSMRRINSAKLRREIDSMLAQFRRVLP